MEFLNKTQDSGNYEYNGRATYKIDDKEILEVIMKLANFKRGCYRCVLSLNEVNALFHYKSMRFYALYKNTYRESQRVDFITDGVPISNERADNVLNVLKDNKYLHFVRKIYILKTHVNIVYDNHQENFEI